MTNKFNILDGSVVGTASDPTIKHVRKTITFDGSAGNGAIGIVTAFTITGRVVVKGMCVFCPLELATPGSAAKISLGVVSDVDEFIDAAFVTGINTNYWWISGVVGVGAIQLGANMLDVAISEDIIYDIVAAAVTGGILVCDVWYDAVTDDGALTDGQ